MIGMLKGWLAVGGHDMAEKKQSIRQSGMLNGAGLGGAKVADGRVGIVPPRVIGNEGGK